MLSKATSFLTFILFAFHLSAVSQTFNLATPAGSGSFGTHIVALPNGNYVITDPTYSEPGKSNIGAVYLYNGKTHTIISKLTGSQANDKIGIKGVFLLNNGNFVVTSPNWNNGSATSAGAVTWVNGVTGLNGTVNSSNSLLGTKTNDLVGNARPIFLDNGDYVISTQTWDNGNAVDAGAMTWCSGITGKSGYISAANSLVGDKNNDRVGPSFDILPNGSMVIGSYFWGNGTATEAGAVTWVKDGASLKGVVSPSNSLVGSRKDDHVSWWKILSNGNYVVYAPSWDNGSIIDAGAATWGNGNTGVFGPITSSNSLVGNKANDRVGASQITALANGNYTVNSQYWGNGSLAEAGAITWGNGNTGVRGIVSSSNSLVGSSAGDKIGGTYGSKSLSNGNYVVLTPTWKNGTVGEAGAATWGNGLTGITGTISAANSLVGTNLQDRVGVNMTDLGEGKYCILSPNWRNGAATRAGAATWSLGNTGIKGTINSSNSLVGTQKDDEAGHQCVLLTNGNFVIRSKFWNNGTIRKAGAVTFVNKNNFIVGPISPANSLVGSSIDDEVSDILPLQNGNFIVPVRNWDNGSIVNAGAVVWVNGLTGLTGSINSSNALIGSSANDGVGTSIHILTNNYLIQSPNWDNGSIINAGAITWADGTKPITGVVSSINSLVGSSANDNVGYEYPIQLANGNYVVKSSLWDNGSIADAGAVTWGDGNKGVTGVINSSNSLVGSRTNDRLGEAYFQSQANGNYLIPSPKWDNGTITDAGAVTWGNGSMPLTGTINSCNSVMGNTASAMASVATAYNEMYDYMIAGIPGSNLVSIYNPLTMAIAQSMDEVDVNIAGAGVIPFINNDCRIIATLQPTESSTAAAGSIAAKVWVESAVPVINGKTMLARHFEITPAENASTATGRVTLFVTQQEFDDFNAHPLSGLKLPATPTDATGKANLKINKFAGTSTDGSGMPASYMLGNEIIDPADTDIIWNEQTLRWEISFDVTGFSGFTIQTTEDVLPITLLDFKGSLQEEDALLMWKTAQEQNSSHFSVERSLDGSIFKEIGMIPSKNLVTANNYQFTDKKVTALKTAVIYYRLKQTDMDGKFVYSNVITLSPANKSKLSLYPNPALNEATLSVHMEKATEALVKIYDFTGRIVSSEKVKLNSGFNAVKLNVATLANGLYYVELSSDNSKERIRLMKQ